MAGHRFIFTYYPRFIFAPKTGKNFLTQMFRFYCVSLPHVAKLRALLSYPEYNYYQFGESFSERIFLAREVEMAKPLTFPGNWKAFKFRTQRAKFNSAGSHHLSQISINLNLRMFVFSQVSPSEHGSIELKQTGKVRLNQFYLANLISRLNELGFVDVWKLPTGRSFLLKGGGTRYHFDRNTRSLLLQPIN